MATTKRRSRRRRVKSMLRRNARRRNPTTRGKRHRPIIMQYGSKFFVRPKSKLLSAGTRLNPKRRRRRNKARRNPYRINRRRRYVRRNPAFSMKSMFSRQVIMTAAKTAGGLALGYVSIPVSAYVMNMVGLKGQDKFAGVGSVIIGALMAGMIKNRDLKDAGIIVAGVGLYDLFTQNVEIGLPKLPRTVELASRFLPESTSSTPPLASSYGVSRLPVSPAAAMGLQSSYAGGRSGYGASFLDPVGTTQGFQGDVVEAFGHMPGIDFDD